MMEAVECYRCGDVVELVKSWLISIEDPRKFCSAQCAEATRQGEMGHSMSDPHFC